MRISTLLFGLSVLLATSTAVPAPAPVAAALAAPKKVKISVDIGPNDRLPINFAKIWVFTQMRCNNDDGPSWMYNILPGEDRCIPLKNIGSIFSWYKSDHGACEVTTHSGTDCGGMTWFPPNYTCGVGLIGSVRIVCPPV
ncbi:hypothetical protein BDW02DRAFT_569361 [Decorospora gaudefroyi]|uniref:Uncharacterized protein n=1 Tax=Decorospora gaudefroyi TaxID=184978 RepID=A0A6A5KDB3_9PLEO|nr:hypothetical protein BDW02DRAFT_569361 [Decorospora gaudefroyi]